VLSWSSSLSGRLIFAAKPVDKEDVVVIALIMLQLSSVSIEVGPLVTAALPTATTDMDCERAIPTTTDRAKGIDVATAPISSWDEVALECAKWCQAKGEENIKRSVHDLVQNQLVPFLQSIDVTRETITAAVQSLVSQESLQQMAKEQTSAPECDETVIRQVQLQVALRLAFWVWGKHAFVASYQSFYQRNQRRSMQKRRGKMKRQSKLKDDRLLQDIIGILQLGALRLPPQRPFLEFVQQCVSKHQSESLANLETVWETFEVDNPFIPKDRDALVPAMISPPTQKPVTTQKLHGSSAPIQQQQTAATTTQSRVDRIDCILPVSNVSLIAPKRRQGSLPTTTRNSLLLGRGKRFVGSHFNTGLTNVQALFRQVPVPLQTGATKTLSSKRKNSQTNATRAKNHPNTKLNSIEPMKLSMDTFASPKRRRVTEGTFAPSQLSVLDTPCRSPRRPCNASHCVADTPLPRPKRLEPPPRAIAGLTLIKSASASVVAPLVSLRRLSATQQQLPVPAKSLVADALSSLSRRQNRRMSA
jgi:hypothetical protein